MLGPWVMNFASYQCRLRITDISKSVNSDTNLNDRAVPVKQLELTDYVQGTGFGNIADAAKGN